MNFKSIKAKLALDEVVRILRQPSSIRGIVVIAGFAGYVVDPASVQHIVEAVIAAIAVIEVLRDEEVK